MPAMIYARPDIGPPVGSTPDPTTPGWVERAADTATDWAGTVPGWVWAVALAALTVTTAVTFPIARAQARRAGARTTGTTTTADRRDRILLFASLTPAALFWLAVLAGSARGLIAFGRDDLRWTDGWEYLVPATLDGIAITFGLLAFRAVRKDRNPDRAVRVAWGAMIASAAINFTHEAGLSYGSFLGGAYLALMSLLGMLIFDELLAQFEDGTGEIRRTNPKFGARWFTWPTNTVCAWFAWRNHPMDGTKASVGNAVEHLDRVRKGKAQRRAEQVDAFPWWTALAPWVRSAGLTVALTEHRARIAAEQDRADRITADLQARSEDHDRAVAHLVERFEREAEQARTDTAERLHQITLEHTTEVTRLRAQLAERNTGAPVRGGAKPAPATSGGAPRLSNDEAVELMLREHPERGYEWGTREVARLTGAGFGRIPKLIAAVAERHNREPGAGDRNTEDDDKEQAS